MFCFRYYRRLIVRHFGNLGNCMTAFIAMLFIVYFIDRYVLTRFRFDTVLEEKHDVNERNEPLMPLSTRSELPLPPSPALKEVEKEENLDHDIIVENSKSINLEPIGRSHQCGSTLTCPDGKVTYQLKSGTGRDGMPTICLDGNNIISPELKNANRGFNVVIVNDKTLVVEDIRNFDVYVADRVMNRYIRLGIVDSHLILVATLDEASYNLQLGTKVALHSFGSTQIDKMQFRDNFVMIGQKGLTQGSAIEKHKSRDQGQEFGESVEISGCLSVPLGKLEPVVFKEDEKQKKLDEVNVGEAQTNCGVTENCAESAFPVHLYTGDKNKDMAKMCINGKYVFGQDLNDAGRGLNIAIVKPDTKEVYRIGRFDTYETDTSNLEIFLEMVEENDIIVIVSHDDASTNINLLIQKEIQLFGSSLISKLSFRDAWVFVGQHGLKGKSPIEQINYAGSDWPKPVDKKLCVPKFIKGIPNNVSTTTSNLKRQQFCRKMRDNTVFCANSNIDKPLYLTSLDDKSLENHRIFDIPMIIIASSIRCKYEQFRLQLISLLLIPGLKPQSVTIFYSDDESEVGCAKLAHVFYFKTVALHPNHTTSYAEFMQMAIEKAWKLNRDAKQLIVLEEDVVVSPDLLNYFAQCLDVIESDESLVGITAWNENGYESVSSLPDRVFRTETFPGLGFLLKRNFFDEFMKGKMSDCCSNRSWEGWLNGKLGDKEMIVPDMSRVFKKKEKDSNTTAELFGRKRVMHLEKTSKLVDVHLVASDQYETELDRLLQSSVALETGSARDCLTGTGRGFVIPDSVGKVYSIFYEQTNINDQLILSLLCKCFKLFYVKDKRVRGIHKGLVRFSYKKNLFFLVGSSTVYYKHKPSDYKPVLRNMLT